MNIAARALSAITGPLFSVIDKAVTDKDEAARLKHEIQTQLIDAENSALKSQMQVVLAEAAGESWLQRNWRPILMLTIVAIVANNYLIAPYLSAMFGVGLTLPLPDELWHLMTLGVGGYIAGQTAERGISSWQQGQVAREHARSKATLYGELKLKSQLECYQLCECDLELILGFCPPNCCYCKSSNPNDCYTSTFRCEFENVCRFFRGGLAFFRIPNVGF